MTTKGPKIRRAAAARLQQQARGRAGRPPDRLVVESAARLTTVRAWTDDPRGRRRVATYPMMRPMRFTEHELTAAP